MIEFKYTSERPAYQTRTEIPSREVIHRTDAEGLEAVLDEVEWFLSGIGYHLRGCLEIVEDEDE